MDKKTKIVFSKRSLKYLEALIKAIQLAREDTNPDEVQDITTASILRRIRPF